jgi:hypothetical protein
MNKAMLLTTFLGVSMVQAALPPKSVNTTRIVAVGDWITDDVGI